MTENEKKFNGWVKRHGGIPNIDGFTKEQIIHTIKFILFEKSLYLNDLADEINLSLDDTIKIVRSLKIGNKQYMIRMYCKNCYKEVSKTINTYLNNKDVFCSRDCYWEYKRRTVKKGKDSIYYNRIKTNCTNCGKEIEITHYDYNKKNKFGDNHNFCSQKCYWEYRSKYYINDKSPRIGAIISQEQIEVMRKYAIERQKDSNRLNSKIQLKINDILDKNNIKYEREYQVKYFAIDNFLIESGLIIEVMGDYWHTSPLKFNTINEIQQRGLLHDKQKHTYIKNHYNKEILYLWENDINKNIDLCEKLILEYINNYGVLENYHSFNWEFKNGVLRLKDEIIIPYQDINTNEYRDLLINKKVG